jgi:predicted aspartyl protease
MPVLVGAPSATDPHVPDNPQQHVALIDTGATESCIDDALAAALGLTAVDKIMIGGSAGAREHNVYLAVVSMPSIAKVQFGRFAGVDLAGGGQLHRVLLGRTFLAGVVMIYDGLRAQVTLAS